MNDIITAGNRLADSLSDHVALHDAEVLKALLDWRRAVSNVRPMHDRHPENVVNLGLMEAVGQ